MAKLKLRKGTKYPFKHLDKIGAKFSVTEPAKNVRASLSMYKKKNIDFIEISVYNTFRISLIVEIKCDWRGEKNKFDFIEEKLLLSNRNTSIYIPRVSKKCEIWPLRTVFFQ